MEQEKKTLRFSKIIVILSIAIILSYTIWSAYTFSKTGMESSTLTTCVYSFWGAELGFLAMQKVAQITEQEKELMGSEK